MKSKDIRVGDEYAVNRDKWKGEGERARVLEVGAVRSVYRGWHNVNYHNGIRVQRVDIDSGEDVGTPVMLLPKDVYKPWPDFVPELLELRRAKAENKRYREANKAAALSRVEELQAFGVKSATLDFCGGVRADPVECLDIMREMDRQIRDLKTSVFRED